MSARRVRLTATETRRKPRDRPLIRSENMARIRGKDTQPEIAVRRALWAAGLRYRLHDKRLPGKPDLVLPRRRLAIFVHGCFWHWHEGCVNFRVPKTRSEWWTVKLARNRARDAETRAKLALLGWRSIVVWECDVASKKWLTSFASRLKQSSTRSFSRLLR